MPRHWLGRSSPTGLWWLFFAHPDDERIAGPLLAQYARAGHRVYLVVATDGRKGITPHARIPAGDSLVAVRAAETLCAARELGIMPPILLGLEDGGLANFASMARLRSRIETAERMVDAPKASPTMRAVSMRHLTVRVAFEPGDFDAAHRAYACHASQYTRDQVAANMRYMHHAFGGTAYLRRWNDNAPRSGLF